ncbi:hypothetical protein N7517_006936 [Penicillium concentricum]|uniref:Uncharacterized protein n=1 Tax=Penicillium concentricum TaxID=293559 RepID=A0A9W9SAP9_9EURO|nr:uncharacterized protein N7517_006936 [Penicillium concentricum]KAJ5374930.1 hypothetical protein N7517_006936 [Penicillium concentricum]
MEVTWPQLFKSDFLNPDVLNATNPYPVWGYAHGPIPNNNPDWKIIPTTQSGYIGTKQFTTALTANRPQAPMVTLNRCDTIVYHMSSSICDILVQDNQLCEASFHRQRNFSIHVRRAHTGAANPPKLGPVTAEEKTAGNNARKRWVLMGGWRDALYMKEPKREIISATMIGYYCDALEEIAWVSSVTLRCGQLPKHILTHSTRHTDAQFAAENHHPGNRVMPLVAPSTPGGDDSVKSTRCEQPTQTEPTSDNDPDVNPDFTSGPDCEIVSESVSEFDSEPEDQEEWPMDAVTDIFAGLYLPSSKLDAAYGPMPEGMDRV